MASSKKLDAYCCSLAQSRRSCSLPERKQPQAQIAFTNAEEQCLTDRVSQPYGPLRYDTHNILRSVIDVVLLEQLLYEALKEGMLPSEI